MAIKLCKIIHKSLFHNPLADFKVTEVPSEIRFDPLTSGRVRIFPVKSFNLPPHDWAPFVEKSRRGFCPFCPGTLEKSTPYFTSDFWPQGRINVGDATAIPNLSPYDLYTSVVVMSSRHYLSMAELAPEVIIDSFTAALQYLDRARGYDPENVRYFSVNWNYMPYSGGSIIHPHLQALAGPVASNYQEGMQAGEKKYYAENGTCFWDDLITFEKANGERYLGRTGCVHWLVTFAPRALVDFTGVLPEGSVDEVVNHLADLAAGLKKFIAYFQEVNIPSFNAALFIAPQQPGHRVVFRLAGRFTTFPLVGSDVTHLQIFHDEPWTPWMPEQVATKMKEFFASY